MKLTNHVFLAALMLVALAAGAWAETPGAPAANTAAAATAPAPITAADVQSLKDALAAQQKQIERLTQRLEQMQAVNQPKNDAAGVQNVSQTSQDTPTLQPAV